MKDNNKDKTNDIEQPIILSETIEDKIEVIKVNENTSIAKKDESLDLGNTSTFLGLANSIDKLRPFAEELAKADAFKSGLKTGAEVLACLVLGNEIGLKPMTALMFGRLLTKETGLAIWKGKSFGLDAVSSMESIHVFDSSKGLKTFVGYQLVTSILNKNNIDTEIIVDFEPFDNYLVADGNTTKSYVKEEQVIKYPHRYQIVGKNTKPDEIDYSKIQIAHTNTPYTSGTAVKFTKHLKDGRVIQHIEVFTMAMAAIAGLATKDVWIKYGSKMCLSKCIGGGGRFIGAEYLTNVYTLDEKDEILGS